MGFIYETPPEDYFFGLVKVSGFMEKDESTTGEKYSLMETIIASTFQFAKRTDWEGDIKDLYFFGLPDPDHCTQRLGVVLKQDNNGTTFIFSPVELDWLKEYQK